MESCHIRQSATASTRRARADGACLVWSNALTNAVSSIRVLDELQFMLHPRSAWDRESRQWRAAYVLVLVEEWVEGVGRQSDRLGYQGSEEDADFAHAAHVFLVNGAKFG